MKDYLNKEKVSLLRDDLKKTLASLKSDYKSKKIDIKEYADKYLADTQENVTKIREIYSNSLNEANADIEKLKNAIGDKAPSKEQEDEMWSIRKSVTSLNQLLLKLDIQEEEAQLKKNKLYQKGKLEEKDVLLKEERDLNSKLTGSEDQLALFMSKPHRFVRKIGKFFKRVPSMFVNLGLKIWAFLKNLFWGTVNFFKNLGLTFWYGDWKTKVSYFIMGFGSVMRGQWLRGILFFLFEVVFIVYLCAFGGHYLGRLYILGEVESSTGADGTIVYGENSFNILLYGVLTLFFIVAFIYTWHLNIKQNRIGEEYEKAQKKLASAGDDVRALVDKDFYKTLLALPVIGILIFTVLPIFFMILVAFTNYDKTHFPPLKLFGWVGFDNFALLFQWTNSEGASFSMTFGQILLWTLVWAFFATFTNYFLGMLVAMLINKKGIKLKKLWRTILVFSIAIPQFISILFVSNMFAYPDGIINGILGAISGGNIAIDFWGDAWLARITVIVINIWIGVPYLMLVVTGILMNIPADLYESANIDGASAWQQYSKITLPYMLFITGPYLLTSFTGNMNNFNVIYLLTGGGPKVQEYYGNAGKTDLLITWLFSLAVNDTNYKLAAVIGIMVFIVVAVLSLVIYNIIPSTRNEEEFQ